MQTADVIVRWNPRGCIADSEIKARLSKYVCLDNTKC